MTGEPTTTLIGNLTADPELRFTPSGSAVANFTIAVTPRTFDRQSNEWKDGETLFARCSIWREAAENVAATLTKGMRVIAEANIKSRTYDTKEGEKRTVTEFEVQEIGVSLRYATAKVQRTQNNNQQGGQQQGNQWNGGNTQPGAGGFGGGFPGAQQQPQPGGGFPGAGQQQSDANWSQPAAQQQATSQQYAQQPPQQGQQAQQQRPAQQYAQAAAAGPQNGAQQPYVQAPMAEDPWATPGVSNAGGGWGNGPVNEPPF